MCFALLVDCTDKCTGQWLWLSESTSKDELPQSRGSLTNNIPSRAIEQANQEYCKDCCQSQHLSNAYIVISVYLNSVRYLILYTRLFMKLNLFEILLYVTFLTTKFSRSMVYRPGICNLGYLPVCSRIPERKFYDPTQNNGVEQHGEQSSKSLSQ